jgi:GntR family transcriptional regulator, arabinose operon transcriptional repressor
MDFKFDNVNFDNSQPLYVQISDIIESKIKNGELGIGQKLPPQGELHKLFNVSKVTLGEAISRLVEEGYLSTRPTHGTFVISSEPKKGLDLTKKNEISLVVCPHLASDIYRDSRSQEILEGMEEAAREKGLYIIYSTIKEAQLTLKGKEKDIAGILVTGGIEREYFNIIKRSKIPFVLLGDIAGEKITDEGVDVIAQDDFQATYLATKHLTALGHKRIAFLYKPVGENFWDMEKARGYTQALKDAGIEIDSGLMIKDEKHYYEQGYIPMNGFLKKSVKFTGIVVVGEACAGAMQAIKQHDLRIPEDISLVCLGAAPGLTSVAYDFREIGRTGVARLIEKLTDPAWKPGRIIIPNRLIQGSSTAKIKKTVIR